MEIGVVGKPNVGKSTLFNALTLLDAPMAPYPFTTTKPNRGVGAVRVPCPHPEKGVPCTPGNSPCIGGIRWVSVSLIDVPGLVPGAHEGKGLGHRFLDNLRPADGFLQVVDLSGGTTEDGSLAPPGSSDPASEVAWLEEELVQWMAEILSRDFVRGVRSLQMDGGKLEDFLHHRLTGLSITEAAISSALRGSGLDQAQPSHWTDGDLARLARELLRASKPRLIAANKCDLSTPAQLEHLRAAADSIPVVPTAAEAELSLRKAARNHLVHYRPGDTGFEQSIESSLSPAQAKALESIKLVLREWGTTGVQRALEELVFGRLQRVAVFPVEDETHWTDTRGRVLPDVLLVPASSTVRDIAFRVHSALGDNFIRAIDARSRRALAAEQPVTGGAVLRIVARR